MFWAAALCAYPDLPARGSTAGTGSGPSSVLKFPVVSDGTSTKEERKGIVPESVLTRKRSSIARIAVLAMIFSLMAVALPASATSVAIDVTTPCPAVDPKCRIHRHRCIRYSHANCNQLPLCVWDHDGHKRNNLFAQ